MLNRKTGKAFTFRGGSPVTAAKLDAWNGAVRAAARGGRGGRRARNAPFVDVPLTIAIEFCLARPAGHGARTGTPGGSFPRRRVSAGQAGHRQARPFDARLADGHRVRR
jgi:hypothetical protein